MILRRILSAGAFVALVSVSAGVGGAQQAPAAVDTSKLGPQVGTAVPPVSGADQFGTPQSLASLSGPKGLMLVFSRSADW